jgi:hypothetical protein
MALKANRVGYIEKDVRQCRLAELGRLIERGSAPDERQILLQKGPADQALGVEAGMGQDYDPDSRQRVGDG